MNGNIIYRFIFAAGGTGGHLYPAVAVAQQIREMKPDSQILFVGTKNKIEASVVPNLGFDFKTIWISGFARKINLKNLLFPVKFITASLQSLMINFSFKPHVAVGAGAYVAGPVVWGASILGAKIVLLEQNSFPGITNRLLERKADEIHISFEESKKYFRDSSKLILSGNPVRVNLKKIDRNSALKNFGLGNNKKTLLVLGGSLGAKSINETVAENLNKLIKKNIQIIWQTGKNYYEDYKSKKNENVKIFPFIEDMSAAYSACDLVLARSGATTIAETANLGLPVIFVPSKNVAANHQYENAVAIKNEQGAELITDDNLKSELFNKISSLIFDENKLNTFGKNIQKFSRPDAAKKIAESVIKLAEKI